MSGFLNGYRISDTHYNMSAVYRGVRKTNKVEFSYNVECQVEAIQL